LLQALFAPDYGILRSCRFWGHITLAHAIFRAITEKTDITMSSDVLAELRERGLIFQVAGEDAIEQWLAA